MAYWSLFYDTFLVNIIIFPWLKSWALPTMLINDSYNKLAIYLSITLATIMTSAINYYIGRLSLFYLEKHRRKIFLSELKQNRNKFILCFILLSFSYISIIGEAICFLMGLIKMNFGKFLLSIILIRVVINYLLIFQNIDIDFLQRF